MESFEFETDWSLSCNSKSYVVLSLLLPERLLRFIPLTVVCTADTALICVWFKLVVLFFERDCFLKSLTISTTTLRRSLFYVDFSLFFFLTIWIANDSTWAGWVSITGLVQKAGLLSREISLEKYYFGLLRAKPFLAWFGDFGLPGDLLRDLITRFYYVFSQESPNEVSRVSFGCCLIILN